MKTLLFIVTIFFSLQVCSQSKIVTIGVDKNDENEEVSKDKDFAERRSPLISAYYRRGQYLIYDCSDQHFACVNDASFKKCQDWRKRAIDLVDDFMPCAPLKMFKSVAECNKAHYSKIYSKVAKKFCIRTKKRD